MGLALTAQGDGPFRWWQRRLQLQTGHWVGPLGPWCNVHESRTARSSLRWVASISGVSATWNARRGLRPPLSEVECQFKLASAHQPAARKRLIVQEVTWLAFDVDVADGMVRCPAGNGLALRRRVRTSRYSGGG
ncbi:jg10258 [Pararge aegeria aegeria]|uniref:Jg10258 protein n=1 Tax=Pararge aegeria aegeria TaxID=348720 RepID=A0A8S4QHZ8_9NEOP|nr:jg10258 [Pararge aegeria aegeria]